MEIRTKMIKIYFWFCYQGTYLDGITKCKKRELKVAQAWGDIKVSIEIARVSIEAVRTSSC